MKLRIAYFAPLLTTGGTQRHLQQVLSLLDRDRFEAQVFTLRPGGEVEAELRDAGFTVTSLHLPSRLGDPRSAQRVRRAAHAMRAQKFDVVHGYQWRPALVGTVVARLARVPLAMAGKRSLTGDDRAAKLAWRVIGRQVDTVVANAKALVTEGQALGMRCRWELIENGVDVDRFRASSPVSAAKIALGLDPERPVIGTVGRLEPRKGHDQFLLAAHAMLGRVDGRRPQVLLVGEGPLRETLARQAGELGLLEHVHFAGGVTDVRGVLAAMDVFVLPSRAEGMSNALLEAMASARPVVATNVGGNPEVTDGGRAGLLVPVDDAAALAAAIDGLLADRSRAESLGATAQRWVRDRFSARASVARLERVYETRLALGRATRRVA